MECKIEDGKYGWYFDEGDQPFIDEIIEEIGNYIHGNKRRDNRESTRKN